MPFKPGQSGNPGGRERGDNPVKLLAKAASPDAMKGLIKLMDHEDPNVQIKARNSVLDRAYGKPAQVLAGENGDGPVRFIVETGVPEPDGS
jgi:hypothetical protein